MRIDQISNKYKLLIIIIVVIPLFILIFNDMKSNEVETKEMYYKCHNQIIKINYTMQFYCDNYVIKYNHNTKDINIISNSQYKLNNEIRKIINDSLNFPS